MSLVSALYVGHVVHQRHRPKKHHLRFRVFSLLVDLDELPRLQGLRLFAHNRRALFSFRDADHGHGEDPRDWVSAQLAGHGLPAPGKVRLLCYPRILGYVFNPLSVWFCDDVEGRPLATVYEVHNTFGERHTYVLSAGEPQEVEKAFYVSPFIGMDCQYAFTITPPGDKVRVAINETENGEPLLYAAFTGNRQALTDANLLRLFFSHPLMTLKVTVGIHWEALKLWRKGIRFHPHIPQGAASATSMPSSDKREQHPVD